ncbi:tail fiber protein [Pseudomonas sp. Marseille-P9899]|uniref:tail fiber protein n=1 Tax=Pseudomonas sp. Marseille-P9899 TaxID=2730401 RepID=UPI00158F2F77|nr:tail fiber protein [Pseudomonas sp. Marseille-P9899]
MNNQGLSVPVGAVLPYAGNLNNTQLLSAGWSICDGSELAISLYSDLFSVIGTCNGGDGNSYFNIPDYQGYFLRGVDQSGTVDKNAATRTAPRSGAATGARVGSVQAFATATPTVPFNALIPHVPTDDHCAYSGTNADMLEPSSAQMFSSTGGGDAETRPLNAYVNYIIKLVGTAALPTGAIAAFAGPNQSGSANLASSFLLCNGQLLFNSMYAELYNAIGTTHGGDARGFNVPDYRGRFLRGVDNGTGRDPDAQSRIAMAEGGATGNSVGSVQDWATAAPVNPFTVAVNIGDSEKTSDHCSGHDNSEWSQNSSSVSFTASGGDEESRPVNVAVDFYVLSVEDSDTCDLFPIGAIIGFPGNVPPSASQWLLCDGSTYPSSGQYQELELAITGGLNDTFTIPDYRGYFLRGTDHNANRDPEGGSRTVGSLQDDATGRPKSGDITGPINHMPTDDADNAAAICCSSVAEWDGAQAPTVGGGDAETRPINANILYYIKYAPTPSA